MYVEEFKNWLLEEGKSQRIIRSYQTLHDLVTWYRDTVDNEVY
jgi:hypothetical protein